MRGIAQPVVGHIRWRGGQRGRRWQGRGGLQPSLFHLLAKRREHRRQALHRPGQVLRVQQAAVPHGVHLQARGAQGGDLGLLLGRGNVFTDDGAGTHGTRQGRQGSGSRLI